MADFSSETRSLTASSSSSSIPSPTTFPDIHSDVLIVGAGPVGLTLAYQLRRLSLHPAPQTSPTNALPIIVHIVERYPKPAQQMFGRAVTFWPRSMEILDQLGLADDIMQQCVAVRESSAYDKDGKEVFGRGWSFVEQTARDGDTRFGFASVLRQKFVEQIMRGHLQKYGVSVNQVSDNNDGDFDSEEDLGHEFVSMTIDNDVELGDYKIIAKVRVTRKTTTIGIESVGSRTEDKWVRIDGVLRSTTHPKSRSYGAIESPIYGNVLWIPLDHGATRIGFALNEERQKLYKELNEEAYVAEAKLAVAPIEIEYEKVDWASVYSVGQRVAKTFSAHGCVFLAGDSCHTHSSGAGQGMNAGMHDASNLGWKLALVLRGLARPELLETYDAERRPNAERLIKYDEDISVLVSGRLPASWNGDPHEDPNVALGTILQQAKGFNTGLTIGYEASFAIEAERHTNGNLGSVIQYQSTVPAAAIAGYRAPDVKLQRPAMWDEIWLQKLTPNMAVFYILVFVGSTQNYADFTELHRTFTTACTTNTADKGLDSELVLYLTILPEKPPSAFMALGSDPLGEVFYDESGSAHERYGVGAEGGLFVLRPDGWIALRVESLRDPGQVFKRVKQYFNKILV
ncbi:hypothetical protein LTR05_003905 [Lithohypha guttulata]|uniref:FAD-binding domain-containing protein n=1 Tax=Lithohypha guttulata TaxID=1690604 RepID=A0AAN7T0J7_9EURO|nr:hypothetical protein LTR05_003905 [Lithohypha guttulata]